jgi:hypothetical protein
MRIEQSLSGVPAPGRKPGRSASGATSAVRASTGQSSESAARSDIAPLVASLHEMPEIRTELIEEVRERLNRGEFMSRDAAQRTAEAILADLASFIGQ